MLEILAAAVALKVAVVAPDETVTEVGTVSRALLLARVTVEPPAGAVWVRVTVQVLTAGLPPDLAVLAISGRLAGPLPMGSVNNFVPRRSGGFGLVVTGVAI